MISGASLLVVVALLVGAAVGFVWRDARAGRVVGVGGLVALLAFIYLGTFGVIGPDGTSATALGCLASAMLGIPLGVIVAVASDGA